jgi:hypothetical protein
MQEYISYLEINKETYDSIRRDTLWNILTEFSIPMN